jgi:hypothetical protein
MFSLSVISRVLLAWEGFLLFLPSLFGSMLMLCWLVANTEDSPLSNLSSLLALCSFYALWQIYFNVLTDQFERGKKLNQVIDIFALTGFILSIITFVCVQLSVKTGMEIFSLGILYVPTYLHLRLEIICQTVQAIHSDQRLIQDNQ